MSDTIIQRFNLPIQMNTGSDKAQIKERRWHLSETAQVKDGVQDLGYMGQYQIALVWKRYAEDIYLSNTGYVARIDTETINTYFKTVVDKFKNEGVSYFNDLTNDQKEIIQRCNIVPQNAKRPGFQIWLEVQVGNRKESLHTMIAKTFLTKPENANIVHHIDNNSYNNSVTNLVWVTTDEHIPAKKLHPMSKKY